MSTSNTYYIDVHKYAGICFLTEIDTANKIVRDTTHYNYANPFIHFDGTKGLNNAFEEAEKVAH